MEYFLIIVATVAGIFFLKFIWDSYLTGTTEKKWREYKQKFPTEAERTERNSFKKIDENLMGKQGNLTNRLKNLMTFYVQQPPELKAKISTNNSNCFEFKMPVMLFGKVVGYNHVGVTEKHPKFDMYVYSVSNSGKKISLKPAPFNEDLSIVQYNDVLTGLMEKLIVRPDYQNLASGIDFEPMNKSKMKKLMDNALKAFTENRVEEAKLMIHEIISYNPNNLKMYFVLIELYLDDKDINQAKNLIDTLNLKSMKGEIVFSDEDYSTLTQLKYRRFEIEENMNS